MQAPPVNVNQPARQLATGHACLRGGRPQPRPPPPPPPTTRGPPTAAPCPSPPPAPPHPPPQEHSVTHQQPQTGCHSQPTGQPAIRRLLPGGAKPRNDTPRSKRTRPRAPNTPADFVRSAW